MLSLIGNKYNPNKIGLYRDDELAVFKNASGPQSEKIKTTFRKIFTNKALDIIISCNVKIVNYLDVSLNLNDGSYDKETIYGLTHLTVRQSKQKLVSSFCS